MIPIPSKPGDLPFAFDIAMGVKKGNEALHARVQQALDTAPAPRSTQILKDFNVPLLERKASTDTMRILGTVAVVFRGASSVSDCVARAGARRAAGRAGRARRRHLPGRLQRLEVVARVLLPLPRHRRHRHDHRAEPDRPQREDVARGLRESRPRRASRTRAWQGWDKLLDAKQIGQLYVYVRARADKVLPPGRPDEVGPNKGKWEPADWTPASLS